MTVWRVCLKNLRDLQKGDSDYSDAQNCSFGATTHSVASNKSGFSGAVIFMENTHEFCAFDHSDLSIALNFYSSHYLFVISSVIESFFKMKGVVRFSFAQTFMDKFWLKNTLWNGGKSFGFLPVFRHRTVSSRESEPPATISVPKHLNPFKLELLLHSRYFGKQKADWWGFSKRTIALPETNGLPLKMDGWRMIVSFWDGLLSGAMLVSWSVPIFKPVLTERVHVSSSSVKKHLGLRQKLQEFDTIGESPWKCTLED